MDGSLLLALIATVVWGRMLLKMVTGPWLPETLPPEMAEMDFGGGTHMNREEARALLGTAPSAWWADGNDPLGWAKRPDTAEQARDLIARAETDPDLARILDAHDVTGCSNMGAEAARVLRKHFFARYLIDSCLQASD